MVNVGAPGGGYETQEKTCIEDLDEIARPWPLNSIFPTVPEEDPLLDPYVDTTIDGEASGWLVGTSMAAPQVAGLAVLVHELESGFSSRRSRTRSNRVRRAGWREQRRTRSGSHEGTEHRRVLE